MGCNYFVVRNRPSVQEPVHIGKASFGWMFHFEAHNDTWNDPPIVWNTFDQIKDWLQKYVVKTREYVIMTEEDEIVPYEEFIDLVESKQNDEHCKNNPDNFTYSRNVNGYRFSDEWFR